jgi:L-amino acid N-acyltransferase YncA
MEGIIGVSEYAPRTSILINGEMVIFKLLEKPDELALKDFFSQLPEHEVENLRQDVRDPANVSRLIQSLDYSQVLPLIAWDESVQAIVALSTLYFTAGVYRHIADVSIVVGTNYRKLGVGSAMIKELIELGTRLGLYFLRAEILMENHLAIKAFRQLGFEYRGTFEDYFMARNGQTRDIVLMLKPLRANVEGGMFYEF